MAHVPHIVVETGDDNRHQPLDRVYLTPIQRRRAANRNERVTQLQPQVVLSSLVRQFTVKPDEGFFAW